MNPIDCRMREGYARSVFGRHLPLVLGRDLRRAPLPVLPAFSTLPRAGCTAPVGLRPRCSRVSAGEPCAEEGIHGRETRSALRPEAPAARKSGSGTVVARGASARELRVGDRVFGAIAPFSLQARPKASGLSGFRLRFRPPPRGSRALPRRAPKHKREIIRPGPKSGESGCGRLRRARAGRAPTQSSCPSTRTT